MPQNRTTREKAAGSRSATVLALAKFSQMLQRIAGSTSLGLRSLDLLALIAASLVISGTIRVLAWQPTSLDPNPWPRKETRIPKRAWGLNSGSSETETLANRV